MEEKGCLRPKINGYWRDLHDSFYEAIDAYQIQTNWASLTGLTGIVQEKSKVKQI